MPGILDDVLEQITKQTPPADGTPPAGGPPPAPPPAEKKEFFPMGSDWEKEFGPRKKG